MSRAATTIVRQEAEHGQWEMVVAMPPPRLHAYVREYVGWFERASPALVRRQPPTDEIPLIFNFGAPFRLVEPGPPQRTTDLASFTTGAYDTAALVASTGTSHGLQVNLTVLGARLFLDRPLEALTNRCVPLDDVLGAAGRRLVEQLHEAPTWDARFAVMDREIDSRIALARLPAPAVLWTWQCLVRSQGGVPIGRLVDATGWSQKHFIARVRHELGLAPKTLARVVRFAHAVRLVKRGGMSLADLALDCGYYDQAHFARECRALAGVSPTELAGEIAGAGSDREPQVSSVQDGRRAAS